MSQRNRQKLIHGSYKYIYKGTNKNGDINWWCCDKRKWKDCSKYCEGRIWTIPPKDDFLKLATAHTCANPDGEIVFILLLCA